jgi:hypothetical protein
LNRQGGSNLQDEDSIIKGYHGIAYLKSHLEAPMSNTIGAVITERNILTPLFLCIQTSPIDFAVASGNENRLFTGKLHV